MSIQFRTNSKTSVDYSSFVTNSETQTGCCFQYTSTAGSTSVIKRKNIEKTVCLLQYGYFIPGDCGDLEITQSSLGCCCACKFSDEETPYTKTTTLCECDSISGNWTLGITGDACRESSDLCITGVTAQSNRLDYRKPRACCHPAFDESGAAYAKCTDVCSEKECAEYAVYPYEATFYTNGRKCNERVGAAAPVINDCALTETKGNIINSCKNGTNLFCWQTTDWQQNTNGSCGFKNWYDLRFAGKYVNDVDGFVVKIKYPEGENNYHVILGPDYFAAGDPVTSSFEAKSTSFVAPTKISFGTHHFPSYDGRDEVSQFKFDGYFATLTPGSIPVYYSSSNFVQYYASNPSNSPIPQSNQFVTAIDIVTTPTFSVFIDTNNKAKIFGRFARKTSAQDFIEYKKLVSIPDMIKKVFKVNLGPRINGYSHELTNGFIAQKLDNSFEYYSPFIGLAGDTDLVAFRTFIRSISPKEYTHISFTPHRYCAIDQQGNMTCRSKTTNNPFNRDYSQNKKYKLVSCSNNGVFTENRDTAINSLSNNDYCFAVDTDNKIYQICGEIVLFQDKPDLSITDVTNLSCTDGNCFATVVPDPSICNNQMLGSCCLCSDNTDIFNCIQTNQGSCNRQGGVFRSGQICYSENNPSGFNCDGVINNNCNSNNYTSFRSRQNNIPSSDLTYFEDGLYIGAFEPNSIDSTIVNGTPLTGKSFKYIPKPIGYGDPTKKWGIIVAPFDYMIDPISLFDSNEQNETILASTYDGRWSTYGDNSFYFGIQSKIMEKIRQNSRLSGWYLPSKNELEFINYKIPHGFHIPEVFDVMKNDIYATSTPYFEMKSDTIYNLDSQVFDDLSFIYGQNFSKNDYGTIYLVPRTKQIRVRLIRRIELE
jgi:hypothetical protein